MHTPKTFVGINSISSGKLLAISEPLTSKVMPFIVWLTVVLRVVPEKITIELSLVEKMDLVEVISELKAPIVLRIISTPAA